jgi:hypothetical protein
VEARITPEPNEDEREAILRALAPDGPPADPPTPWRRAALDPGPCEPLCLRAAWAEPDDPIS